MLFRSISRLLQHIARKSTYCSKAETFSTWWHLVHDLRRASKNSVATLRKWRLRTLTNAYETWSWHIQEYTRVKLIHIKVTARWRRTSIEDTWATWQSAWSEVKRCKHIFNKAARQRRGSMVRYALRIWHLNVGYQSRLRTTEQKVVKRWKNQVMAGFVCINAILFHDP